jgi:hypothetical protein
MDAETTARRKAVLDVLARRSPFGLNAVDLGILAKTPTACFQAEPQIRRLGEALR